MSSVPSFVRKAPSAQLFIIWAGLLVSIVLAIAYWPQLSLAKQQISHLMFYGVALVITEIFFTAGALIMAVEIGAELSGEIRGPHWLYRLRHARRNLRKHAKAAIRSRWFGLGFWLNFIGAVGTSLILIVGIMSVAKIAGLGLIAILAIDLVASFAWRVPLHINRRKMRTNV